MPVSTMHRSTAMRRALAVTVTVALAGAGTALIAPARAAAPAGVGTLGQPAAVPSAVNTPLSALTPTVCPPDGGGTPTCDLWAKAGSVALPAPASAVAVWTFVGADSPPVKGVGPTLVVPEGQAVKLVLHNDIPDQTVSLSMPQVDGFPENAGAGTSGQSTYTFTPSRPGTFIYEAGGTTDGARQAAMGLVGALVVLPTPADGTAYGTPYTAYTDESVVVMSDIDPGLAANPMSYDMRNFSPRFHLFNGVPYPATAPIDVNPADKTLLRLVNGGIVQHSVGILGTTQTVVAESARPLTYPYGVAAENVPAGDTIDMIVSVPAGAGMKYAVYDSSMRLDNDGAASAASANIVTFGGGLTFLQTPGGTTPSDPPPVVTSLSLLAPTRVSATATTIAFNAAVTDNNSVQQVQYSVDSGVGPWTPVTPAIVPASTVTLTAVSIPINPTALGTGTHQVFVRGTDANGPGTPVSVSFKVDLVGPNVTGLAPAATVVNGSAPLAFSGNASDVGGGNVGSVTWKLDGSGTSLATLSPATGPTVALTGSIPVVSLTEGAHILTGVAVDDLGNVGPVGPPSPTTFVVDKTAPTLTGPVAVNPSPNDGKMGVSYDPTSIEVRAPVSDGEPAASASGVVSGEGFIGTAGANGTGFAMVTNTSGGGLSIVGTIPLSQLTSLPEGPTSIWVHAKDKAGNWGTPVAGTLVMQRALPAASVTGLALTPSTATNAATTALAATATAHVGTTVSAAEYFIDADPGVGNGKPVTVATPGALTSTLAATIPISAQTVGTHTVGIRVRTANGAWGPNAATPLILNPLVADGFESAIFPASPQWQLVTNGGNATATRSTAAALTGSAGLQIAITGTAVGNNNRAFLTSTTLTPGVATFHAQFQLSPNTLTTGNRWVSVYRGMGGNAGGAERFRVEYQRITAASTAQVRLIVSGATTTPTSSVVSLNPTSTGVNTIRVDYSAAASATVTFTVNGVATTAGLTALNTAGNTVTASRLGISQAPAGTTTGAYTGVIYLDAFTSAFYGF